MAHNSTDVKAALVQAMAWWCQTTSHYLSQFWPRSQWWHNQQNSRVSGCNTPHVTYSKAIMELSHHNWSKTSTVQRAPFIKLFFMTMGVCFMRCLFCSPKLICCTLVSSWIGLYHQDIHYVWRWLRVQQSVMACLGWTANKHCIYRVMQL